MATINDNYLKLPGSYLFAEIARRVAAYKEANPDADIIRLGIGDVTQPLPQDCIEAMHKAVDDQDQLPGVEPMMIVIGLAGKVWAPTTPEKSAAQASVAKDLSFMFDS